MTRPKRNTATRDRHRRNIAARKSDCGICGEPINYQLPYLHPESFVVDHIIPIAKGGLDVLSNKQAAHRSCNRAKSDHLPGERAPASIPTVVTSRCWW